MTDDELLALARKTLNRSGYAALTYRQWKDGIDVDFPCHELHDFAAAATAPIRADLAAAKAALPAGWRVRTNCDGTQRWIVITGPRGQSAAFEVDICSVRAEVLRDLARDFDAALAGEGK